MSEGLVGVIRDLESLVEKAGQREWDYLVRQVIPEAIAELKKVVKEDTKSFALGCDLGELISKASHPIQNLAAAGYKSQELFVLPGTDMSVSVAMTAPTAKIDGIDTSFMVYFKRKSGPPASMPDGYIHINVNERSVDWSCRDLKI